MEKGADRVSTSSRAVRAVCVVPADLSNRLVGLLRDHFAGSPVEVVAEQRSGDRRSGAERRRADVPEKVPPSGDRRRIHNTEGRRVAERRATVTAVPPPEDLPRRVRRYAQRLAFGERTEPSAEQLEDDDTARRVIAYQAGDEDAFSTLYRRYFDRVYAYLRLVLRDSHEAEDITQDVFMRALGALRRYERRSQPFRAWLFTIARNQAVTSLERSQRLELADDVRGALEQTPARTTPSSSLMSLDWLTSSDMFTLIERLPERQRQVLILRFVLDLSSDEVARVMEISSENVRVLQHRALGFLRERLIALGRGPTHRGRIRMRTVGPKAPVVRGRRFALTG